MNPVKLEPHYKYYHCDLIGESLLNNDVNNNIRREWFDSITTILHSIFSSRHCHRNYVYIQMEIKLQNLR